MREELAGADEGEKYKLWGDLLTANIYRVGKGADSAVLENYYDEMKPVKIPLDSRLTPQANAQKYYKKYQKSKSAKVHLAEQITLAEGELEYIRSVDDALSRAEGETDLAQLREELAVAGYASKLRTVKAKKPKAPAYLHFRTSGGYDVYCGKNNLSNDYIRTHLASKNDWWFHVKDRPGLARRDDYRRSGRVRKGFHRSRDSRRRSFLRTAKRPRRGRLSENPRA